MDTDVHIAVGTRARIFQCERFLSFNTCNSQACILQFASEVCELSLTKRENLDAWVSYPVLCPQYIFLTVITYRILLLRSTDFIK
jgi:hypothetical protein